MIVWISDIYIRNPDTQKYIYYSIITGPRFRFFVCLVVVVVVVVFGLLFFQTLYVLSVHVFICIIATFNHFQTVCTSSLYIYL